MPALVRARLCQLVCARCAYVYVRGYRNSRGHSIKILIVSGGLSITMQSFIRRQDCCNETRSPWVRLAKCSDFPWQQTAGEGEREGERKREKEKEKVVGKKHGRSEGKGAYREKSEEGDDMRKKVKCASDGARRRVEKLHKKRQRLKKFNWRPSQNREVCFLSEIPLRRLSWKTD